MKRSLLKRLAALEGERPPALSAAELDALRTAIDTLAHVALLDVRTARVGYARALIASALSQGALPQPEIPRVVKAFDTVASILPHVSGQRLGFIPPWLSVAARDYARAAEQLRGMTPEAKVRMATRAIAEARGAVVSWARTIPWR